MAQDCSRGGLHKIGAGWTSGPSRIRILQLYYASLIGQPQQLAKATATKAEIEQ